jgi:hypothetical protein
LTNDRSPNVSTLARLNYFLTKHKYSSSGIVFKKCMPSMIVNKKFVPAVKKVLFAATAVFALTQCSQEEELLAPAATPATPELAISAASASRSISSLTVSGIHTAFATAADCKKCTYVVPEGTTVLDGKEIGLQPGNILCLNTAFEYGALELTNLEGTEENPIVITTVGTLIEQPAAGQSSSGDPY